MDRRDLGSWLSGPLVGPDSQGQRYRGEHLGLPEDGRGSVAGINRRIVALLVDWMIATLLVTVLSGDRLGLGAPPENSDASALWTLGVFFALVWLSTAWASATMGQRLLGVVVVPRGGGRVGLVRGFVRTVLLCLVIPAVIYDKDARGLHDRAADTIVLRSR